MTGRRKALHAATATGQGRKNSKQDIPNAIDPTLPDTLNPSNPSSKPFNLTPKIPKTGSGRLCRSSPAPALFQSPWWTRRRTPWRKGKDLAFRVPESLHRSGVLRDSGVWSLKRKARSGSGELADLDQRRLRPAPVFKLET